ncbi:hypothetical protein C4J89_3662 [Pseudomonas sp. R4-35-07]|nr:hypothetical protein C4J89_3662 [Pseudomonas sp. R4-35-07]
MFLLSKFTVLLDSLGVSDQRPSHNPSNSATVLYSNIARSGTNEQCSCAIQEH